MAQAPGRSVGRIVLICLPWLLAAFLLFIGVVAIAIDVAGDKAKELSPGVTAFFWAAGLLTGACGVAVWRGSLRVHSSRSGMVSASNPSPGRSDRVIEPYRRRGGTASVAEPLDPGDEDQFVGLVDQEGHQALGVRAEVQAAQRPGRLARGVLVFRRVDDDGGVEQGGQRLDGAWREACDLVLGEVFQFPPVHSQEPYRVRISSRVMRCSGPGGPSAA